MGSRGPHSKKVTSRVIDGEKRYTITNFETSARFGFGVGAHLTDLTEAEVLDLIKMETNGVAADILEEIKSVAKEA